MSAPKKRLSWFTLLGFAVLAIWLAVTLALRFEPFDTRHASAQVSDNNVLSEPTDTGVRFIYETVFELSDGHIFKLQNPTAPPAVTGPICAAIHVGKLTGKTRYEIAAEDNCP